MKFSVVGAMSLGFAVLMGGMANAATLVLLDDFTMQQEAGDLPTSDVSNTSTMAFGSGERTLTVQNTKLGAGPRPQTALSSDGGYLSFSNTDRSRGWASITYTNLGDIEYGPDGYFLFDIGVFDATEPAIFSAEVMDTNGNTSMYSELLAPGFNPKLAFADFSMGADFNSVASLSFRIDSTNTTDSVDGSLRAIYIGAVPLPAGGLLLLSGIGGVAALRRRKQLA